MSDASEALKIARINAWQAIGVALIGAVAGIAGTVGVRYMGDASERADTEQALAEQQQKLVRLQLDLKQSPILELRVNAAGVDPAECNQRARDWFSRQERSSGSYDGSDPNGIPIRLDRVTVQAVCPKPGAPAVVAATIGPPFEQGDGERVREMADGLMAALLR